MEKRVFAAPNRRLSPYCFSYPCANFSAISHTIRKKELHPFDQKQMKDVFHVHHTVITLHTPYSVIPIYRLFLLSLLSLGNSLLFYLHFFSLLSQTPIDSNQDSTPVPVLRDPSPQQSNQTHLHCARWQQEKNKFCTLEIQDFYTSGDSAATAVFKCPMLCSN